MGWQEDAENDETCAPLTEDEMREFQAISEQVTLSWCSIMNLQVATLNTYLLRRIPNNFDS